MTSVVIRATTSVTTLGAISSATQVASLASKVSPMSVMTSHMYGAVPVNLRNCHCEIAINK